MSVRPIDLQVLFQQEPHVAKIREFQKQFPRRMKRLHSLELRRRSRILRTPPIDPLDPGTIRVTRTHSSSPPEESERTARRSIPSTPSFPEEKGSLLDLYAGTEDIEGGSPPDTLLREKGHLRDENG